MAGAAAHGPHACKQRSALTGVFAAAQLFKAASFAAACMLLLLLLLLLLLPLLRTAQDAAAAGAVAGRAGWLSRQRGVVQNPADPVRVTCSSTRPAKAVPLMAAL
jgi:hypothetical protein